MIKKLGTLAMLFGFFLSSASFTTVEMGQIAKSSYAERSLSAATEETGEQQLKVGEAEQYASFGDCIVKMTTNNPTASVADVAGLCHMLFPVAESGVTDSWYNDEAQGSAVAL